MTKTFRFSSIIEAPREDVFAWHEREGALERLSPPWDPIEIIEKQGITSGSVTRMIMREGPVPYRWTALHFDYEKGRLFRDRQLHGPLSEWTHSHIFSDHERGCELTDEIVVTPPFFSMGDFFLSGMIKTKLSNIFRYRHETTICDLRLHSDFIKKKGKLKILVSGASGLIGSNLVPFLTTGGHTVSKLVRRKPKSGNEIFWDPEKGLINPSELEGFDAIIHLAGENIGESRWTEQKKRVFLESRTKGTKLLADAAISLKNPPEVFISASATGFYGNRGNEILNEKSRRGDLFISELCDAWEKSSHHIRKKGIRLVNARIGVVLTPSGGALSKMLPLFRLGLGGKTGKGNQFMPWISLDDVIAGIYHMILSRDISGPVNMTSPFPVTNSELCNTVSRIIRKPAIFDVPEETLRFVFGQMADEILISGTRAVPEKLMDSGFSFLRPDLETALRHCLGKA